MDAGDLYPPPHNVLAAWADEQGNQRISVNDGHCSQWWFGFARWLNAQAHDRPEFDRLNQDAFDSDGQFHPALNSEAVEELNTWGITRALPYEHALRRLVS